MNNISKLEEFTVEELQEQLKEKKIDKEFLIEYIVKRDKVYNLLIDEVEKYKQKLKSRRAAGKYHCKVNEKLYKERDAYKQRIDKVLSLLEYFDSGQLCEHTTELSIEIEKILKGEPNNE